MKLQQPKQTKTKTDKTRVCHEYYLERTRINDLQAILKEGLYVDVDNLLAVGELVTFEIGGELKGVKKSPSTTKQVSQALLKENRVLTRWKELQEQAQRLQKDMDALQDEIAKIEKNCLVQVETGYSIKTLQNPQVDG